MIFLFVIAIFVGYYMCKKGNRDSFEGFAAIDDARQAVRELYNTDIDAIRNLSTVATKLQAGGLTHPGRLTVNSGGDHIPIIAQSNTDSHILLKTKNDPGKDAYLINRDGIMRIWAGDDRFGVNRDGTVDIFGNLNTPQIRRVGGDWLRINNDGVGRTALFGNLSINDSTGGNGGLAVGSWNDKVGQGNIAATGTITAGGNIIASNRNILAELNTITARLNDLEKNVLYRTKLAGTCKGWDCNQEGATCLPNYPGSTPNQVQVCVNGKWTPQNVYAT